MTEKGSVENPKVDHAPDPCASKEPQMGPSGSRSDASAEIVGESQVDRLAREVRFIEDEWFDHNDAEREGARLRRHLQDKEIDYAMAKQVYPGAKRSHHRRPRVRITGKIKFRDLPGVYQSGRTQNPRRNSQERLRYDYASGKCFSL